MKNLCLGGVAEARHHAANFFAFHVSPRALRSRGGKEKGDPRQGCSRGFSTKPNRSDPPLSNVGANVEKG